MEQKIENKPRECSYHLCKEEGLYVCPYCGDYFCRSHKRPKKPGPAPFKAKNRIEAMELRDPSGHPCPTFTDYLPLEYDKMGVQKHSRSWQQNVSKKIKWKSYEIRYLIWKYGTLVLLLVLIACLLRFYPNETKNAVDDVTRNIVAYLGSINQKCSDGTLYNQCSLTKPLYCVEGHLRNRASTCGCPENYTANGEYCTEIKRCYEGTAYGTCSPLKPSYCSNGVLVDNSTSCGCPDGYVPDGDACKIPLCEDGTRYGACSTTKPKYCQNGVLVDMPSSCGCPSGSVLTGAYCLGTPTLEARVHELINEQRRNNGILELSLDVELSSIAREHSEDMAARNFFSHYTPEGLDPTARGSAAGYVCSKNYGSYYTYGIAENIFQAWTYSSIEYTNGVESGRNYLSEEQIANQIVNGWMNSPGHRQNILTSTYDREGIGISITNEGKIYVTEDFC